MKIGSGVNRSIGENIKRLRTKAGMTQKQLATVMGVTESLIRTYESGRRNPKLITVMRFANALGCLPADILPSLALDIINTDAETGEEMPLTEKEQAEIDKALWLENIGYFYDMLNPEGRKVAFALVEGFTQIQKYRFNADTEAEGIMQEV